MNSNQRHFGIQRLMAISLLLTACTTKAAEKPPVATLRGLTLGATCQEVMIELKSVAEKINTKVLDGYHDASGRLIQPCEKDSHGVISQPTIFRAIQGQIKDLIRASIDDSNKVDAISSETIWFESPGIALPNKEALLEDLKNKYGDYWIKGRWTEDKGSVEAFMFPISASNIAREGKPLSREDFEAKIEKAKGVFATAKIEASIGPQGIRLIRLKIDLESTKAQSAPKNIEL